MFPRRMVLPVNVTALLFTLAFWAVWAPPAQVFSAEGAVQAASDQAMDSSTFGADPAAACREVKALLEEQKTQMGREFGQIKREMAVLREDLGKPGVKEIFAGIGYILGLAGIALFMYCRRTSAGPPSR